MVDLTRSTNRGPLRAIAAVFVVLAVYRSLVASGAPSRAHDADAMTALTADARGPEADFLLGVVPNQCLCGPFV